MAKLSQLQQAYNNPNVRRFLNAIADAEGVKFGYNTLFSNQQFNDFSAHPNVRKSFNQTNGTKNITTAAGRYQFIKPTWDGLARQYGFKDFSPQSQDLGAIALIAQNGALDDVLMGRYQNAVKKLGNTWASLPSSNYAQPKRSWEQFNRYIGNNTQDQKRQPILGKWDDFVAQQQSLSQQRSPISGKWSDLNQDQKRQPILGKWDDFVAQQGR